MVGLRGSGKTVLLDRMRDDAEASGVHTIRIEAPENRSLPALLAPQLRVALLRLSKQEHAKDLAMRALRALAGCAKGLKFTYKDIEVGLDYEGEPGLADNGDLEHDLQELLESSGAAAKAVGTALSDLTAAALVYRARQHVINVFVVRSRSGDAARPETRSQDGFGIVRWSKGGLDYVAVSDLNVGELAEFAALMAQAS